MVCDNQKHLDLSNELLFLGSLVDSNENWEFYHAEQFQRPSRKELQQLKGIIIGSSSSFSQMKPKGHIIKNKIPKDDTILKQFVKRGGNHSEIDDRSSVGASTIGADMVSLNQQTMNIIGDKMLPQNETWIEKLADFIKDIDENYPHIKIVGC